MKTRLLNVEIAYEHDVVLSRQRARQIAALLGFGSQDQVRIATTVSEIARNAFRYAKRGRVEFFVETKPRPVLRIILSDKGSGIPNLETILDGKYVSRTGMGLGIIGAKKLMDRFAIETGSEGTTVLLEKFIPYFEHELQPAFFASFAEQLSQQTTEEPFAEVQQQNQELLAAFTELEKRQNELTSLNLELKKAHTLLDAQNDHLEDRVAERTAELKASLLQMERFCYSIAQDLKAPIRAITGLTEILKVDYAPAFDEAGKKYADRIIGSAKRMDQLIYDLLEFGRLTHIEVEFVSLNLKTEIDKTLANLHAEIVTSKAKIEVEAEMPNVIANPVLLQQVLCNLIENALKFVKAGVTPELKLTVENNDHASSEEPEVLTTRLWIQDNGIGIPSQHQKRIFNVFERLHDQDSDYPGTGIGLALVQKAVERMNGSVGVESTVGQGSRFWFELPTGDATSLEESAQ